MTIHIWIYFWALYSVPLIYNLFMCHYYALLITVACSNLLYFTALHWSMKSKNMASLASFFPRLFWVFRILWGAVCILWLIFFLQKHAIEILIRIVLNLYKALSYMDILTILSLPVNMGFLSIHLSLLSFHHCSVVFSA